MFGLFQKTRMTHEDVKSEMQRRKSHNLTILARFKSDKVLYTHDLAKISYRYSARINDLRNQGHRIICEYVKPGVFMYTYKGYRPGLRVS